MLKSLQTSLLEIIRIASPASVSLDKLFIIGDDLGHKQSLVERKLRILVASGLITVLKDTKGQNYAYKAVSCTPENMKELEIYKPTQEPLLKVPFRSF